MVGQLIILASSREDDKRVFRITERLIEMMNRNCIQAERLEKFQWGFFNIANYRSDQLMVPSTE